MHPIFQFNRCMIQFIINLDLEPCKQVTGISYCLTNMGENFSLMVATSYSQSLQSCKTDCM